MITRTLLLLLLIPVTILAQPSATMRRALLESVDVELSASSHETLERAGAAEGAVSVLTTSISVSGRHPLDAATLLVYGLAYQRHGLDTTTPLLPDQLAELTFNLGLQHRFSAAWSGAVFARPGFYSDFEDLSARSLNLPVLGMLTYNRSATLAWNLGLNLDAFSDHPVLPIAGVRWQFAPDWTFSVGFPVARRRHPHAARRRRLRRRQLPHHLGPGRRRRAHRPAERDPAQFPRGAGRPWRRPQAGGRRQPRRRPGPRDRPEV